MVKSNQKLYLKLWVNLLYYPDLAAIDDEANDRSENKSFQQLNRSQIICVFRDFCFFYRSIMIDSVRQICDKSVETGQVVIETHQFE